MVYVWRFSGSVSCKQKKIQALRKYTEKQNDFKIQVPAGYWEQNIKFKEIKWEKQEHTTGKL